MFYISYAKNTIINFQVKGKTKTDDDKKIRYDS